MQSSRFVVVACCQLSVQVPRDDPDRDIYSKYDDQLKKLEAEDGKNMAKLQREDSKYPMSLLQEADPSSADPPPAASTLEQALREFKPVPAGTEQWHGVPVSLSAERSSVCVISTVAQASGTKTSALYKGN